MFSKKEILRQLNHLGLGSGDLVMVHASLRKLGPVEGRADGVVATLLEAIGEQGTLIMVLGSPEGLPFVAEATPVDPEMGVLAETFRKTVGVELNDHAAARFAARGPLAQRLFRDNPLHDYYGEGSVMQHFTEENGKVLRLAADIDTVTLTHWAEYEAKLSHKKRVRRRYLRKDIGEQWIESLDDCEGIQKWPKGDYFSQILIDFLDTGQAQTGPVGDCQAELFSAQNFVPFAVRWMEKNLE